ncbi:hypothetical protein PF005_g7250 [Phytophthora fragariae]|uniref:Uncharacterized protein n=1 Tax=Phytophthora fragariae TaxID=53985 RepID=A0A6A4EDL5_9STRA|nr:hypothetical protein PF003_g10098 [Phytophthora fragariae]KAE8945167.1 hypothetical protein PF009_g5176 [Phytophthora fragariae]KAE9122911.1 hypothetical protein PF010_g6583 [Phytophthora fragariae]KAE9129986.1 hypothetical protein PF007_g4690 [Phytophthora fragariae]KAE9148770.1 hypothetical protein PF006_g6676 [Phytophthora fragariae]
MPSTLCAPITILSASRLFPTPVSRLLPVSIGPEVMCPCSYEPSKQLGRTPADTPPPRPHRQNQFSSS